MDRSRQRDIISLQMTGNDLDLTTRWQSMYWNFFGQNVAVASRFHFLFCGQIDP